MFTWTSRHVPPFRGRQLEFSISIYFKRRHFRAVYIFAHFAQGPGCTKI